MVMLHVISTVCTHKHRRKPLQRKHPDMSVSTDAWGCAVGAKVHGWHMCHMLHAAESGGGRVRRVTRNVRSQLGSEVALTAFSQSKDSRVPVLGRVDTTLAETMSNSVELWQSSVGARFN